jgi:hypothetical protein
VLVPVTPSSIPPCQFGFQNPIPHNYCSASQNSSILPPCSHLPKLHLPSHLLTSPNPTFSPTIQLGSKAHRPSYISVPLELFEKCCILPLVCYVK